MLTLAYRSKHVPHQNHDYLLNTVDDAKKQSTTLYRSPLNHSSTNSTLRHSVTDQYCKNQVQQNEHYHNHKSNKLQSLMAHHHSHQEWAS